MARYYVVKEEDHGSTLMFYLIILVLIAIAAYYLMLVSLFIGGLVGGVSAVLNYGKSLWKNVNPRRRT